MVDKVFDIVEFNVPVYGSKVTFIVFKNTWREVIKHLKDKGFDTKAYKGWHYVHGLQISENIKGQHHFVVIINKRRNLKETLVHELFHLTQDILEYKGVEFKKGGDNEAYAYLIGALFSKTEKLLDVKNKK
jgi:hypothetical protein